MKIYTKHFFIIFLAGIIAAGFFAHGAEAASITFQTSSTVVHQGQEISIDVLLDPKGQNVNTLAATIVIPKDLDYVGIDDSTSIVGLWVDEPTFDKTTRTLTLSGIVPGGFTGLIDPFSPNQYKPGTIIRLLLRGHTTGSGLFSLPDVQAFLNDGLGTETQVSSGSLPLVVDELLQPGSLDFFPDNQGPLPFTPVVERDILLYNNQRVLIFNTKDKGSGMDHYEVKEGNSSWVVATSPYLLKDQKMTGDILVKAVDRAGNERIEAIPGANPLDKWQVAGLIIVFLLLFILTMLRLSHHVHQSIQKTIEKKKAAESGANPAMPATPSVETLPVETGTSVAEPLSKETKI